MFCNLQGNISYISEKLHAVNIPVLMNMMMQDITPSKRNILLKITKVNTAQVQPKYTNFT